jgi:hypothetical protein
VAAIIFLLALPVFGEADDPYNYSDAYEVYTKIQENESKLSSFEINTHLAIRLDLGGKTADMLMEGTLRQITRSETDTEMEMRMDMFLMGQPVQMTSYYKEGYIYQKLLDKKIKNQMNEKEILTQANASSLNFTNDSVIGSNIEQNENGVLHLVFNLKPEAMGDALSSLINPFKEAMGDQNIKFNFDKIKYEITTDHTLLTRTAMVDIIIRMFIKEQVVMASYVAQMDAVSYNSLNKIDFPPDLDSYKSE